MLPSRGKLVRHALLVAAGIFMAAGLSTAQFDRTQRNGRGGGGRAPTRNLRGFDSLRLRDLTVQDNREGIAIWDVNPDFKTDLFTFVRIEYDSYGGGGYGGGFNRWLIDYPNSDLNFSFRLQQMTSLKVNPFPTHMRITDPRLFDYPFIYMLEIRSLIFSPEEVSTLRRYLLNGGFLMVDDHWGLAEQANFIHEIKRVFPDRPLTELTIDHPIFHSVFDLKALPQVPGIYKWQDYQDRGLVDRTWEEDDDPKPHYRAIYDDKGRMCVLECANTDFGDGWEQEASNEDYFHQFSEKQAYPMGINIIYYALTH